jgi:hypothetical protein
MARRRLWKSDWVLGVIVPITVVMLFAPRISHLRDRFGLLSPQGQEQRAEVGPVINDRPAHPLASNPAIPDRFAGITHRALAKQTQERYEAGEEMARVMRECAGRCGRRGRMPAAVRG